MLYSRQAATGTPAPPPTPIRPETGPDGPQAPPEPGDQGDRYELTPEGRALLADIRSRKGGRS